MNADFGSVGTSRSARMLVFTVLCAVLCAVAQIAWCATPASTPATRVAQEQAQVLVALVVSDVRARRMSMAMFRLAQAEALSPRLQVPIEIRRQLNAFRIRERVLLAQADDAMRREKFDVVRGVLAQLVVADRRSPAALALMLRLNAELTRRGGQYHRHRWYAAESVVPNSPETIAERGTK